MYEKKQSILFRFFRYTLTTVLVLLFLSGRIPAAEASARTMVANKLIVLGYDGPSATSSLYKNSDGSYSTGDGRLTAAVGQPALLIDGTACSDAISKYEHTTSKELFTVRSSSKNALMLFYTPVNGVVNGARYNRASLYQSLWKKRGGKLIINRESSLTAYKISTLFGVCHNGTYMVPVDSDNAEMKGSTVRVMYYSPGEVAVLYMYASFTSAPYTMESLSVMDMSDGSTEEEKKNTISMKVGESTTLSAPETTEWQKYHTWEILSGSSLISIQGSGETVTVKALAAGTAKVHAATSHPYLETYWGGTRKRWMTEEKTYTINISETAQSTKPAAGTKLYGTDGIIYKVTGGNTVSVCGFKSSGTTAIQIFDTTICDEKWTFKITAIEKKAFRGSSIKSVSIGKNVTTIGAQAFYKCSKLTSVSGGAGLKTIGDYAFAGSTSLKSVTFNSKKLTGIGKKAFQNCTSLSKLGISSVQLKKIGSQAFIGCRKLTSLTLKSQKLSKSGVKNALKGSSVSTIKTTSSLKKKYKSCFTKANCGKKVTIR